MSGPPVEPEQLPESDALVSVWKDYVTNHKCWETHPVGTKSLGKATKPELIDCAKRWYLDANASHEVLKKKYDQDVKSLANLRKFVEERCETVLKTDLQTLITKSGCISIHHWSLLEGEGINDLLSDSGVTLSIMSKVELRNSVKAAKTLINELEGKSDQGDDKQIDELSKGIKNMVVSKKLSDAPSLYHQWPNGDVYRIWRESFIEWKELNAPRFDPVDMYLNFRDKIHASNLALYQHATPAGTTTRTVDSLLEWLDKRFQRSREIDDMRIMEAWEACARGTKKLKSFRLEYEEKRERALRTGRLTKGTNDVTILKRKFGFKPDEVLQIVQYVRRQQNDWVAQGKDLKDFCEHDQWLEYVKDVELAIETTNVGDGIQRGRRWWNKATDNAAVSWVANHTSPEEDALWKQIDGAFFAAPGKGGKGKGEKGGKGGKGGKKGGKGRSVAPQPGLSAGPPRRNPCPKGADCQNKEQCKLWHPGEKAVKKPAGGGGGGKGGAKGLKKGNPKGVKKKITKDDKKIGGCDRPCPSCKANVFSTKLKCFKCGADVPAGPPKAGKK